MGVVNPPAFRYIDDVGCEVRPSKARKRKQAGFFIFTDGRKSPCETELHDAQS